MYYPNIYNKHNLHFNFKFLFHTHTSHIHSIHSIMYNYSYLHIYSFLVWKFHFLLLLHKEHDLRWLNIKYLLDNLHLSGSSYFYTINIHICFHLEKWICKLHNLDHHYEHFFWFSNNLDQYTYICLWNHKGKNLNYILYILLVQY